MTDKPTSGKYGVSQNKERELLKRMEKLEIREDDIIENFIKGSGKGRSKDKYYFFMCTT